MCTLTTWCEHNLDLTGATFDGGHFSVATFSGGEVDFSGATFSGGHVSFSGATFSGGQVDFSVEDYAAGISRAAEVDLTPGEIGA
ncbi:pentapeptide repeat-containing protein [Streptomyces microflavus]|uniref:pentapeptide repeat-containing protein n=1 Tax=Streptomyces microflavus TaxID=1919 RepID=UPI00342FAD98